jgi:hypothetical protein
MMTDLKGDMATLAGNMAALQEMERLRVLLEQAGVEIILLKGAAFLDTLYPDLSERRMCDIDFLIRQQDKVTTWKLIEADGYQRSIKPGRQKSNTMRTQATYTRDQGRFQLDIHWELGHHGRHKIDYSQLFNRAQVRESPNRKVVTLSTEDAILFSAIHAAKDLFREDPRRSVDLNLIIQHWKPCWRTVIDRAWRWNSHFELLALLKLENRHNELVPAHVMENLPASPMRTVFLDKTLELRDWTPKYPIENGLKQILFAAATLPPSAAFTALQRGATHLVSDFWSRTVSR